MNSTAAVVPPGGAGRSGQHVRESGDPGQDREARGHVRPECSKHGVTSLLPGKKLLCLRLASCDESRGRPPPVLTGHPKKLLIAEGIPSSVITPRVWPISGRPRSRRFSPAVSLREAGGHGTQKVTPRMPPRWRVFLESEGPTTRPVGPGPARRLRPPPSRPSTTAAPRGRAGRHGDGEGEEQDSAGERGQANSHAGEECDAQQGLGHGRRPACNRHELGRQEREKRCGIIQELGEPAPRHPRVPIGPHSPKRSATADKNPAASAMRMATGAAFESLFVDRMIQSPFAAARSPKSALPGPWYTSPTRHGRPKNPTESSGARIRTRPPPAPPHPPAIPNAGRGVVIPRARGLNAWASPGSPIPWRPAGVG